MIQLPPFKFIQYIYSCSKGFSYDDEHIYDEELRAAVQEGGFVDTANKPTDKGNKALKSYSKYVKIFESLALDLVELVHKDHLSRDPIPMCGYAVGFAKSQGWVEENERGLLECTLLGATAASARRDRELRGVL